MVPLFRHFSALGWFGITHGIVEWYTLILRFLVPRPPPSASFLLLGLTAVSFGLLMQFGTGLTFRYHRASGALRWIPLIVVLVFVIFFASAMHPNSSLSDMKTELTAAIRLGLAFPATLLVAAGLHGSSKHFAQLQGFRVSRRLNVLAIVFTVYGILTGLIVNSDAFFALTGIPVELLRGATAIAMAGVFAGIAEDIRRTRAKQAEATRQREFLRNEKERINRELHDRVIQALFAAGLHLDQAAESACLVHESDQIKNVRRFLGTTIQDIRRFIEDNGSSSITTEQLITLLSERCGVLHTMFGIDISFSVKEIDRSRGAERVDKWISDPESIASILTEAISNACRHGNVQNIDCVLMIQNSSLELHIKDDGSGFNLDTTIHGNGIPSMRFRAAQLDGTLTINPSVAGTRIVLAIPSSQLSRSTYE